MPRRLPEPDPPPPLGAVAIDGSNVVASAPGRAAERLALALAWARAWRADLPLHVFFDHTLFGRCSEKERSAVRAVLGDTPFTVTPRGESADPHLLRFAAAQRALLLTNDRFRDHGDLCRAVITLQFAIDGGHFAPHGEATWFLPNGTARRVTLAELQRRGAPATG
ncbi:MAG: hypothetical protein AB7O97_05635 [Planctomycetota bacterium]